ncbi:MAG: TlpA family protein disulfide reductase [Bacteroidota bacterium]
MRILLIVLTAAVMVTCGPPRTHEGENVNLTDFDLIYTTGVPVKKSDLQGKQVVLNIWATWCKPCIQEMPSFRAAQEKLKDQGVVFLFASDEPMDLIRKFDEKRKPGLQLVRLENYADFNFQAIPVTFVFNKEGIITHFETGSRNWDSDASLELLTKTAPLE